MGRGTLRSFPSFLSLASRPSRAVCLACPLVAQSPLSLGKVCGGGRYYSFAKCVQQRTLTKIILIKMVHQTKPKRFYCNISSMRRSVSSPDETPRRMLKNTTRSGGEVFHLLMKHCVECLILLLKQNDFRRRIEDAKMSSFSSDFQTLIISFVFSL